MTIAQGLFWMALGGLLSPLGFLVFNRFARFKDRTLDDVVEFLIYPEHEQSRTVFDPELEQELRFLKVRRNFRRTQRRRLDLIRKYFRTLFHDMRVVVEWADTEWNDMLYLHAEDEYDAETHDLMRLVRKKGKLFCFLVLLRLAHIWFSILFLRLGILPIPSITRLYKVGNVDLLKLYDQVKAAAAQWGGTCDEEFGQQIMQRM
jgi:hypothetical protein